MNGLTKAKLYWHILRWRLTWAKRDTRYRLEVSGNPKFMSAREAAGLIRDGDVVGTSGLAGNQRVAIMYWAIRELFEETGHPRSLTMLCTGGQGSRGRVPGSMEDLGAEGLCTRLITGHQETFKSLLKLAAAGKLEMQCIPQGQVAFLMAGQALGEDSRLTSTGIGTFMDPRVGSGSRIFDPNAEQLITVEGDKLRYRVPKINVAMFGAPAADHEGNIYLDKASVVAETFDITRAAKKNGGRVIANVGTIVEKGDGKIVVPAEDIDAVVYDPRCEQAITIKHKKYWPMLTTQSDMPIEEAITRLRFINQVLGITPRRTPVDDALARLAAKVFADNAWERMMVNIGVGLPEEACRILFEAGLLKTVTVFTESGVIGGLPAPGVFFGGAACPKQMVSSSEVFKLCYEKLDLTMLGVLEADSDGNVNVSKRGADPKNYVGPGGFIDITTSAKMVVFVTTWMAHADMTIENGAMKIVKPGAPKFIDKVSEITFSGKEALKTGKKVFYVTNVGVFRLTERGMELILVMPGIDIQKDILGVTSMRIVMPESGNVPVADSSVVTGQGFKLSLNGKAAK